MNPAVVAGEILYGEGAVLAVASPIARRGEADCRSDGFSGDCSAELSWQDGGLEGPGDGKFRYVFPVPEGE